MFRWIRLMAMVAAFSFVAGSAHAHCQVPCGIYDDEAEFDLMLLHCDTIEKAMTQIDGGELNVNQATRWVMNKDEHADMLTKIVTYYFLTQRIKPVEAGADGYDDYQTSLELLHQMMVHSMKCKQTTDVEHVAALRGLIETFRTHYHGH